MTESKKTKKSKSGKSNSSSARLWNKGAHTAGSVVQFTAGIDSQLDEALVYFDAVASAAHAKALAKAKILTNAELSAMLKALSQIATKALAGQFKIPEGFEDSHTAIEAELHAKLNDTGLKIHTGRSRNDQVAVAMRLFLKQELFSIWALCAELSAGLSKIALAHEYDPMPGYTHTRKAMVSSIGLWAESHAEAFLEAADGIKKTIEEIDKSPLGSASGFGTPANLDREYTAKLLGFSGTHKTALYAQTSRIRAESLAISRLAQTMSDAARFSSDVIFFSSDNGYIKINSAYTTGSSLMPNKQNPDVFELVRAKASSVLAHASAVQSIQIGTISGYNRDYQQSKAHIMAAIAETKSSLVVLAESLNYLEFDTEKCASACTADLLATDKAVMKALSGTPFRKAYQMSVPDSAEHNKALDKQLLQKIIRARMSLGATGNLKISLNSALKSLQEVRRTEQEFNRKLAECLR